MQTIIQHLHNVMPVFSYEESTGEASSAGKRFFAKSHALRCGTCHSGVKIGFSFLELSGRFEGNQTQLTMDVISLALTSNHNCLLELGLLSMVSRKRCRFLAGTSIDVRIVDLSMIQCGCEIY